MAHGDFSDFDAGRGVGSATLPCKGSKKAPQPTHWIEIEMVDDNGHPCPGHKYKVKCPDGSIKTGTLNRLGFARVAVVQPGNCQVSFSELDKDAWEPAQ